MDDLYVTFRWLLERAFRRSMEPALHDFNRAAALQTVDVRRFLLEGFRIGAERVAAYEAELDEAVGTNPNRDAALDYPEPFAVEHDEALVLYCLVRDRKPAHMVETGVANGFSSYVILSAMERNGVGQLVSYDPGRKGRRLGVLVPAALGSATIDGGGSRWVLREGRLPDYPKPENKLGMFLHDSSHTYVNHSDEYGIGWRNMEPGGVLMSDDVDSTFAFLDFAKATGRKPNVLVGYRKVFAAMEKPGKT
jgi:hypothetical protein